MKKNKVFNVIEEINNIKYTLNLICEKKKVLLEPELLTELEYDPQIYDSIKRAVNHIYDLNRRVTTIINKEIYSIYSNYEEIMTEIDLLADKNLTIEWLYHLINRTASTLKQILDVIDGEQPGMFEEYVVELHKLQGLLLEDIEEIKVSEEGGVMVR